MEYGRIIRVLSGFYTVFDGQRDIVCKARGKFRKDDLKPLAGDFCDFSYDGQNDGYLMKIHPRKNCLIRPPIANVDQAFIVVSCQEPDFSSLLLDRFLAIVEHQAITPVIVVTKMDLVQDDDPIHAVLDDYRQAGYQVYETSHQGFLNEEDFKKLFKDKVSVFTGQSGVGKSSLLNRLAPDLKLKTGAISNVLGRGKHTTRHVELYPLYGGWVADTPGFSSLDLDFDERDLAVSYHDFRTYANQCKFRGCLHKSEPDCAVKEAVKHQQISAERYQHYLMFLEEIQTKKGKR